MRPDVMPWPVGIRANRLMLLEGGKAIFGEHLFNAIPVLLCVG